MAHFQLNAFWHVLGCIIVHVISIYRLLLHIQSVGCVVALFNWTALSFLYVVRQIPHLEYLVRYAPLKCIVGYLDQVNVQEKYTSK